MSNEEFQHILDDLDKFGKPRPTASKLVFLAQEELEKTEKDHFKMGLLLGSVTTGLIALIIQLILNK